MHHIERLPCRNIQIGSVIAYHDPSRAMGQPPCTRRFALFAAIQQGIGHIRRPVSCLSHAVFPAFEYNFGILQDKVFFDLHLNDTLIVFIHKERFLPNHKGHKTRGPGQSRMMSHGGFSVGGRVT